MRGNGKERNTMNRRFVRATVLLAVLALLSLDRAHATPVYGYAFGVSLVNIVVPGSVVSIEAGLMNTGDTPIVFPSSITGGPPSVQGGSVPFAGAGWGGQWNIGANNFSFGPTFGVDDFFDQFEGAVVYPGDVFHFVFGTFLAPIDESLCSVATASFNFGIDFTDTVLGNLLYGAHGVYTFDNTPTVAFMLGGIGITSHLTFFEGQVVDTTTGRIFSGPATTPVPEPSTLLPLASGLAGLGGMAWRRHRRG
jgi:hypothetical protein